MEEIDEILNQLPNDVFDEYKRLVMHADKQPKGLGYYLHCIWLLDELQTYKDEEKMEDVQDILDIWGKEAAYRNTSVYAEYKDLVCNADLRPAYTLNNHS